MTLSRILLIVAVAAFAIAALSAFSDDVTVNESGFIALGLATWSGSSLAVVPIGLGRPRVVAGRRAGWREDRYA